MICHSNMFKNINMVDSLTFEVSDLSALSGKIQPAMRASTNKFSAPTVHAGYEMC